MLKWLNPKPVCVEIVSSVEDNTLRVSKLEDRVSAVEKSIRSVTDHFEELEFELTEKITALSELISKTKEDLISTTILCQNIEIVAKSTASTTVSKNEFLEFVNTLAAAVAEARSRLDLPF